MPTDESLIFVAPAGENAIVSTAAAAHALDETAVTPILTGLSEGDLLLMQGNLTRAVTAACLERAREAGARTMLNSAPIAFDYEGLWPAVGIAVVNEVESALLTGIGDPTRRPQAAFRVQAWAQWSTTLGAEGVPIVDGDGEHRVPATAVEAVDTTGAGDVFCGVLAAGARAPRTRALSAVRWAVAATSCRSPGAAPRARSRAREELAAAPPEALASLGE